jgi:F420-non-reducing hydrogenase large subunit
VDAVFSAPPPRAALLQRELLNAGSYIHSHAIHFFALAGPDLFLGLGAPAAQRNLVGLLAAAPDLAKKALRLRTIGQRIAEIVGGRGTHPVAAVAGGMASPLHADTRARLKELATEALEISRVAVAEGKRAIAKNTDLVGLFPLATCNMGTVRDGSLQLYDGVIRTRRSDGTVAAEFAAPDYRKFLFEEALPFSYAKQVFFRDPGGSPTGYRVGALARLNACDKLETPLAQAEFEQFKKKCGHPCHYTVMSHWARLIELLHCAERAVELLKDDEMTSDNVRAKPGAPKSAIAHIEAPRGVLIHDYTVDNNGIVQAVNLIVATQHNMSAINATVQAAAQHFWGKPDDVLLNGVEFAIRCYDPCLSCSTHQVGKMPLEVTLTHQGQVLRQVRR